MKFILRFVKGVQFTTLTFGLFLSLGCQKNKDDSGSTTTNQDKITYAIESTVADMGQSAKAAESGTALLNSPMSPFADPKSYCTISSVRSACTGSNPYQRTISWGGCSLLGGIVMNGTITETYTGMGAVVCQLNGSTSVLNRLISTNDPWKMTFPSGRSVTVDMDPGTAWDGTTFPNSANGTEISRIESGTSNGLSCAVNAGRCFHIVTNGSHKVLKGSDGTTWFDHKLESDITFTGDKSNANRVMAGTSTLWHEIAKYKVVNTFSNVTWGDSTCCYPTSGSVTSVLTGSVSGSVSLSFSATCGEATFTDTSGAQSATTLFQCAE